MSAHAESAPQPDERLITIELDSDLNEALQREYTRLCGNPSRTSFDDFLLLTVRLGLEQMQALPAEELLNILERLDPGD